MSRSDWLLNAEIALRQLDRFLDRKNDDGLDRVSHLLRDAVAEETGVGVWRAMGEVLKELDAYLEYSSPPELEEVGRTLRAAIAGAEAADVALSEFVEKLKANAPPRG